MDSIEVHNEEGDELNLLSNDFILNHYKENEEINNKNK